MALTTYVNCRRQLVAVEIRGEWLPWALVGLEREILQNPSGTLAQVLCASLGALLLRHIIIIIIIIDCRRRRNKASLQTIDCNGRATSVGSVFTISNVKNQSSSSAPVEQPAERVTLCWTCSGRAQDK